MIIKQSAQETIKHIRRVQELMAMTINKLIGRMIVHDKTKLEEPEASIFDEFTSKLSKVEYGSQEYKQFLNEMTPALQHHYQNNSHHPEHYQNGIKGMSLLDLLEMICDWKAASERHETGNILKSLEVNKTRFGYSDELYLILLNTVKELFPDC